MPWPLYISAQPERGSFTANSHKWQLRSKLPFRGKLCTSTLDWRLVSIFGASVSAVAVGLLANSLGMDLQVTVAAALLTLVVSFVYLWRANPIVGLRQALVCSSLSSLPLLSGDPSWSSVVGVIGINLLLLLAMAKEQH